MPSLRIMEDKDLKLNRIYWAEITDQELTELCGQRLKVKFTGIFFRNIENLKQKFYLYQIKVFREANEPELFQE